MLVFLLFYFPWAAHASVVSVEYVTDYVDSKIEKTVSLEKAANQTMAGNYTVSGTLNVPTPPLPTVE